VEGSVELNADDSGNRGEPPVAAFFDLDKTVISKSSTLAFGRPFYKYGLISRSTAARSALGQLVFTVAGAGPRQMERIREWAGAVCRGWPVDQVTEIVARHLDQLILPIVYDEARSLIARHKAAGHDLGDLVHRPAAADGARPLPDALHLPGPGHAVVIISSSGHEVVDPIARLLGVDDVIATRMQVAGGRYTGQMEFWAYGTAKADRVQALAAERGYQLADCYAYSDSATDLPLLETVGHPHAVNPDRPLRKIARERGWPILEFGSLPPARRGRAAAPGQGRESSTKGQVAR
jgi:phosphoserine phosphatase